MLHQTANSLQNAVIDSCNADDSLCDDVLRILYRDAPDIAVWKHGKMKKWNRHMLRCAVNSVTMLIVTAAKYSIIFIEMKRALSDVHIDETGFHTLMEGWTVHQYDNWTWLAGWVVRERILQDSRDCTQVLPQVQQLLASDQDQRDQNYVLTRKRARVHPAQGSCTTYRPNCYHGCAF